MLSRLAVGPRVASLGPRLEASIRGCGEQVWDDNVTVPLESAVVIDSGF